MILAQALRLCSLLLVGLTVLLLGAMACGDEGEGPVAQTAPSIKIGVVLDESGPLGGAPAWLSQLRGAELAIGDINDSGGVKVAGKTYRLELIKVDSRSNPVDAVAAAQQLIQQKVLAAGIATCPFFPQVYAQLKAAGSILVWSNCPPGLNLLDKNAPTYEGVDKNPLYFATRDFTEPFITAWIRGVLKVHPDIKKMGFFLDDGPLGKALAAVLPKVASLTGLEFVGGVTYPLGTTDFSAFITNAKANKPDFVYSSSGGAPAADLGVQMAKLQLAPHVMLVGLQPADLQKLGSLSGVTFYLPDIGPPYHKGIASEKYIPATDRFGELKGGLPVQVGFAIVYYDYVQLIKQAMEKAGTVTDAKAVAQALVGQTVESYYGGKATVREDHGTRGPLGLVEVSQDKITVYVYPDTKTDTTLDKYSLKR